MSEITTEEFVFLDDELLNETANDIALAGASAGWHRVGKLTIGMTRFMKWVDRKRVDITHEQWKNTPVNQRGWDYTFKIDIAEFNQTAKENNWSFERRIGFKSADWWQIFVPSVEEVFGTGSMDKDNYPATMKKMQGAYVDFLEVPQSPGKDGKVALNEKGKPWTTCKVNKVFGSQAEAAEYAKQFETGANSNGTGPDVTNIPAKWYANSQTQEAKTSNIQAMLTYIKQQIDSGKPASDVAKSTAMEGTSPALNANGQPVNLAALFAQATGMPEAMFTF